MSDDRKLLELAAKAAGLKVWWGHLHLSNTLFRETAPHSSGLVTGAEWNPLTDDGDALRLAVKLKLCLGPNFDSDTAVAFGDDGRNITEDYGADPYAATRRAITRAAAAIGEKTL